MLYDASLKAKRDWDNTVAWAAEQAATKERVKAEQEKLTSARKMLKAGMQVEAIAEFLNLPLKEIEKLK